MKLLVLLAIVAVGAIYLAMLYNGLVALRESVREAWANIDVLLKQRHDEVPKLVETCKRYMQFESDTLERVMRARNAVGAARDRGDVAALGSAEGDLRGSIGRLFAVAENYPQLKTDEAFRQLQARISALEAGIADRREFYNDQVRLNNTRIAEFPDVLIARRFGFKDAPLLTFDAAETKDIDVGALFKG